MIARIVTWAVEKRWLVLLLTVIVAAIGAFSLYRLPIDAVPDITNNQVQINVRAPALSPELVEKQATVQAVIAEEEAAFTSMLSRGIKELNARADAVQAAGGGTIDGEAAFFLYDTMGFPLDLTELMAAEKGDLT